MRDAVVSTGAEMALYFVAVQYPQAFTEAEREARTFSCAMLANDEVALRRSRAILAMNNYLALPPSQEAGAPTDG